MPDLTRNLSNSTFLESRATRQSRGGPGKGSKQTAWQEWQGSTLSVSDPRASWEGIDPRGGRDASRAHSLHKVSGAAASTGALQRPSSASHKEHRPVFGYPRYGPTPGVKAPAYAAVPQGRMAARAAAQGAAAKAAAEATLEDYDDEFDEVFGWDVKSAAPLPPTEQGLELPSGASGGPKRQLRRVSSGSSAGDGGGERKAFKPKDHSQARLKQIAMFDDGYEYSGRLYPGNAFYGALEAAVLDSAAKGYPPLPIRMPPTLVVGLPPLKPGDSSGADSPLWLWSDFESGGGLRCMRRPIDRDAAFFQQFADFA